MLRVLTNSKQNYKAVVQILKVKVSDCVDRLFYNVRSMKTWLTKSMILIFFIYPDIHFILSTLNLS